ncbi:MAG: TrbC/VirB2 family protein [Oscillospiraceae bacterium]|nr:TrbC/VirB2 family protein [Oscillospiraceae bacterium]
MKQKKILKIVIIFLLLISIVFINIPNVFASIPTEGIEIISPEMTDVENVGNRILGIVQVAGAFISVIILIVLGIKYMLGSVEEKAEMKKSLLIYILGVFLLFGTVTIASLIYNVASSF